MIFVPQAAQKLVYRESLHRSGYVSIHSSVIQLWKMLVQRGLGSLLPGFMARFIERLSWQNAGQSILGRSGTSLDLRFFSMPVWGSIEKYFKRLDSLDKALGQWCEASYQILDWMDIGRSERFHWGELEAIEPETLFESAAMDYSDVNGLETSRYMLLDADEALQNVCKSDLKFGLSDIFRLSHPELFASVAMTHLHQKWDEDYSSCLRILGSIPGVEDFSDELEIFSEPEFQMNGGYCDIEMRGEGVWSALFASELAFEDRRLPIDLFDIKYLENQLLFFKKDEGVDRVIRRRIRIVLDIKKYSAHTRALARCMVWLQLIVHICSSLFEKDRVQLVIKLSGGNTEMIRNLSRILVLRVREQNPNSRHEIRFSEPVLFDGLTWQNWLVTTVQNTGSQSGPAGRVRVFYVDDYQENTGLLLKTQGLFEQRLITHVRYLMRFFEGREYGKVPT